MEAIENSASRAALHIARGVSDAILNKLFHTLLTNTSNKLVHVPNRMSVAYEPDSLRWIIATEAALLETNPDTIGAVHYRPLVNKATQITRHEDAKPRDN